SYAATAQAPAPLAPEIAARGNAVYARTCAACHDNALTHAPGRAAIASLTTGRMQQQAAALSAEERQAVAQAVTSKPLGSAPAEVAMPRCTGAAARFD